MRRSLVCYVSDLLRPCTGVDAGFNISGRMPARVRFGAVCLALSSSAVLPAYAADSDVALLDLSLEQLSRIRVTSVSRRSEPLATAAASIYVITNEDIRRSGARTLPEALRLAPNLQVARLNAREYAISARGFNSTAANKLLVQLDGRSLYTPLFSGVLWDAQDIMLADVDRIEVISGPGATLWGSNAVNGVINIITRSSRQTQGTLVVASTGEDQHDLATRHGGKLDNGAGYRVYAKRDNYELSRRANGVAASDVWSKTQAGFRFDSGDDKQGVTVQGDAYNGNLDPTRPERQTISGSNLLMRWNGTTAAGNRQLVRFYFDGTHRHAPGIFEERLSIFDLLVQQDTKLGDSHNVIAGAGYRFAQDRIANGTIQAFLPGDQDLRWGNLFVQDDFALSRATRASIGARAEYNIYTHWEFLPSLRLSHAFNDDNVIWSALSRSVRAPSRIDRDLYSPASPPFLLGGGPDFGSEVSNTAEIGYRAQATSAFSYSLTTFYQRFRRLRGGTIKGGSLVFNNGISGHTYGIEAWTYYRVNRDWRIDAGFLRMRQDYASLPGSLGDQSSLGNDPKYQWQLRTLYDATNQLDFTLGIRHVSALPNPVVPSYTAIDVGAGYKFDRDTRLTLTILNAQGGEHREFGTTQTGSEFDRTIHIGLTVMFR